MLPSTDPVNCAVHSSAFESLHTLSRIVFASCSVITLMSFSSAEAARGVDDVGAVEARRARAVRDGRYLPWLPLAVEERAAEAVVLLVADRDARVPEFRRADLVRDVLERLRDLAVFDLVEELPAELRVVTLLVDRERAVADDVD